MKATNTPDGVVIGDLDITGNQITVEALINRVAPYTPANDYRYAGDIVSKHRNPTDCNYLLRPRHAEITTTNGFFATPATCDFKLNKTYHVALVYDGSTLRFYRNGFLMSQIKASGNLITNDWLAKIGEVAGPWNPPPTNFNGYINEVRIWNVARTQAQIRANMSGSLSNPTSQPGLQAYYTFDNLKNKQGNTAWNGITKGGAVINQVNTACNFIADSCEVVVNPPFIIPDFTIPDTVCVNEPVNISNKTVGVTTNYWNFCVAGLNDLPKGTNLGNIGGSFSIPVFMDYAYDKGNYYGFLVNYYPGGLTRLDFGNSLLNTPTTVSMGNFGGIIPPGDGTEGIQIVYNEHKWYAIIVGGHANSPSLPRVLKIEFGANLSNPSPVATNWGNMGNMLLPIDLHVFKEGNEWYGFTVNADNNSITRFSFSSSFDNVPTATNLGNLGNLAYPTGIYAINDNGFWRVFIVNAGDNTRVSGIPSLTRLDFGSSLLNTPVAVNLGNPGGMLKHPRDLTIMKSCGEIVGFAVNGHVDFKEIIKLDFNNDLSKTPTAVSLGNIGNVDFPHSISKLFRVNNDLFAFITNAGNNTITRLNFSGCVNTSMPNSNLKDPLPITYSAPGNYNINLTIDDGLATQNSVCKQVVVLPKPSIDFSYQADQCNPASLKFFGSESGNTIKWDFGDGTIISGQQTVEHVFLKSGVYKVSFFYSGFCSAVQTKNITISIIIADIIKNKDTVICKNGSVQMKADSALSYCWSPTIYLDNSSIGNPIAKPLKDITYYLTSKTTGINLVKNGDFNQGNTGFSSAYSFNSNGFNAGVYFVGASATAWHPAIPAPCNKDHTLGNGNMMLVNGADQAGVKVWSQNITVSPNTQYEFSCWLQHITSVNPAKLQFAINGIQIGEIFNANSVSCIWDRFFANWNSGSLTTAEISIVNMNTAFSGNDFALDDISFAPVVYKTDSIKITINKPSVNANNDTSVCVQSLLPLKATGALTYSWSPRAGLNDSTIANPVASIKNIGSSYIVTGTNAIGCISKDTVKIGLLPAPLITISNDTTICGSTKFPLKASGGISYQWSPAAGLDNPAINNPVTSTDTSILYHLKVIGANGCSAVDSVKINVFAPFGIIVSKDTAVCPKSSVQLLATGGVKYQWSPAATLSNAGIANPVALPSVTTKYKVIVSNVNNCTATDSVTISALALPAISISKDSGICKEGAAILKASGGIAYAWLPVLGLDNPASPNPIASPGINTMYKVAVTGANTCKATDSVQVNILPAPVVKLSNDTALCGLANIPLKASGGVAYQWSPATGLSNAAINNPVATPLSTTLYSLKVTGANTCIAFDSVKINVYAPFIIKVSNDTAVCPKSTVQLNATGAVSYQWSPAATLSNSSIANPIATPLGTTQYKVIARNAENCLTADSVIIAALALPAISISKDTGICREGFALLKASGGIAYKWTPVLGLDNAASATPLASPGINTRYKVEVTGANTCKDSDSLWVNILPAPVVQMSTDTSICGVGSVPLKASGGSSYLWSPSIGLSDNLAATPLASPVTTTNYQVKVTGFNTCTASGFVQVSVFPALVSTISNDTAVCGVNTIPLKASGGIKYQWTPATGLSNSLVSNPTATPLISTIYSVKIINADNCTSTRSVSVDVHSLPVVSITKDTSICRQDSIQLLATGGTRFQWSPSAGISNASVPNPVVSPSVSTTYRVIVTDINNCQNLDSVRVAIRPVPQFAVVSSQLSGCAGEKILLGASGGDNYFWSPSTGLSGTGIPNPSATLQNDQAYSVTISESVCQESASFDVRVLVKPLPPVTVTKSNDITCNVPFSQLNAKSTASQYSWTPIAGLSNSTISNPVATPLITNTYKVLVFDDNGCSNSASVTILVNNNNDFRLFQMPNAFTPGADGKNDCFGIAKWGNVKILRFEIFNRWGQLVFTGSNTRPCWDGSFRSIPQPSGNFVYILRAETLCGILERKGNVVLIR